MSDTQDEIRQFIGLPDEWPNAFTLLSWASHVEGIQAENERLRECRELLETVVECDEATGVNWESGQRVISVPAALLARAKELIE